MYLPWPGIFEQFLLADVVVYYDDVQLPRGKNFNTRVQIKTSEGWQWMSIPVQRETSRIQKIDQTRFVDQSWRKKHLRTLEQAYGKARFFARVRDELLERIFRIDTEFLSELCIQSGTLISAYLGIAREVHRSSQLKGIETEDPTQRLLLVCQQFEATDYVSGKGGMRYIQHDRFEAAGIAVNYMDYALTPYRQLHGEFNPYVTTLDLLMNEGPDAATFLVSQARYWRDWPELASPSSQK